jgi:hypothetical protein
MLVQGAQIYKKSTSHLRILGARRVREASFVLRTDSSAVTCGLHCYLVLSACQLIHTFVWDGETIIFILKICATVENLVAWNLYTPVLINVLLK